MKTIFCWLAETKAPIGGYLQGRAIRGKIAVTILASKAQKFRTKEGCQAFIEEWDEAEGFAPVEHAFDSELPTLK